MHPILSNFRRLSLYLAAWIPLAGLVVFLLAAGAGFRWSEAVAAGVPLCLVYAFVCLSSWYSCRATPLGRSGVPSLLATHLSGAIVASALWILAARILGAALSHLPAFPDLSAKITNATGLFFGLGVLFYLLAVALFYVLLAIDASRQAEERALQAQIQTREAELRALKAQINPHFLFNSLHSISALTSADPAKAREMCIRLGDFLRRTLGLGEKEMISLGDELALVRAFLSIEKVRFGARLEMREEIEDGAQACLVPPLLLQPLVENAIAHGISNLVEGGWIRIVVRPSEESWTIVVENRFDPESPSARRNGVGLENVRRRLATSYGNRARLDVKTEGDCFRVSLLVPVDGKSSVP
ncbi:MAG: histidine kinase [Candidatus Acidiferrales bacterium]